LVFHVLNRGVRRMTLFETPTDYYAFLTILGRAERKTSVSLFAYCLMSNHFHLVVRPLSDSDLSKFMFWVGMLHSQRWHATHRTRGTGPVYQGRFKAIPAAACSPGDSSRALAVVESVATRRAPSASPTGSLAGTDAG